MSIKRVGFFFFSEEALFFLFADILTLDSLFLFFFFPFLPVVRFFFLCFTSFVALRGEDLCNTHH